MIIQQLAIIHPDRLLTATIMSSTPDSVLAPGLLALCLVVRSRSCPGRGRLGCGDALLGAGRSGGELTPMEP